MTFFSVIKSARPGLKESKQVHVEVATETEAVWGVDLYNDDIHTFDEVTIQLMKATGCTRAKADSLAWTVHNEGLAHVYEGQLEECLRVAGVLNEIGLVTQIRG